MLMGPETTVVIAHPRLGFGVLDPSRGRFPASAICCSGLSAGADIYKGVDALGDAR
jgi:hypothetical protein